MALFFTLKKNVYTGINTFLFGGFFGVFYAKIIIFMARVLVLSIKFSFHSISGYVCRTMSYRSLSGDVHYVSFIDDFSRKTWIYFLKWKNEVFIKFKEYKSLVESQTERNIKTLQSDNGGDFTSKEFKELCRDSGIKRELRTPYNPQQNGVREQKNQTIMETSK